jgi:quercetin dioxygenase-like cupin family protein
MKTLTAKNFWNCFCGLALILLSAGSVLAGDQTEKFRNEKVLVVEQTLAPGDTVSMPADRAGVVVYFGPGLIESTSSQGKLQTETVKRGDVVFRAPQAGPLKNAGSGPLRVVWTGYLGNGSSETWGAAGLAPNYKLLFENQYGRVYDIKIAAGKYEPLHTHHDRVVVCLSGAELEHTLQDGRKEPATLKTDEIAWRRGVTHIGHNLGKTDLWVIAIEPK